MANTIYFADGSREVLFYGMYDTDKKVEALERILRERLGDDTAALFREIMQDRKDEITAVSDELKSYEGSCESYRSCLQEVFGGLGSAAALLVEKRLDRKKMDAIFCNLMTAINNEL